MERIEHEQYAALRIERIRHERATVVRVCDERGIDDTVLRRLQRRRDIDEVRLAGTYQAER